MGSQVHRPLDGLRRWWCQSSYPNRAQRLLQKHPATNCAGFGWPLLKADFGCLTLLEVTQSLRPYHPPLENRLLARFRPRDESQDYSISDSARGARRPGFSGASPTETFSMRQALAATTSPSVPFGHKGRKNQVPLLANTLL